MANQNFRDLLDKYLTNTITEREKDQFFLLLQSPSCLTELEEEMEQQLTSGEFEVSEDEELSKVLLQKILEKKGAKPVTGTSRLRNFGWRYRAAAAVLVLCLATGYLLWMSQKTEKPLAKTPVQVDKKDVEPGGFKASLKLADGSVIHLNKGSNGKVANQGSTAIINQDQFLVYNGKPVKEMKSLYNTLYTSNGETYALVLSDGSKVWLNSASSITFPVAFTGPQRKVEITGEAYFEIKHREQMPFRVLAKEMEVLDLGTEFNIEAYSDEALVKTTLVTGRARVIMGKDSQILLPGQQTQVDDKAKLKLERQVDVEEAVAWKNGLFRFRSAEVESVMRQLARWYDINVSYEGKIPNGHLSGMISRNTRLGEVLKMLELNNIHCRMNGRKLAVLP